MKIAIVLAAPPGYSETFFNSQIRGLIEEGHDVTLFTGNTSHAYKLCRHIMHPKVNRFYIVQICLMVIKGLSLLPTFKAVRTYFQLETEEGTPIKRIVEKIYINASLLKYKGDWIHYGFATMAVDRELVPQAVGAKMAVSFRGYDINVYPLKHLNCYGLLWRKVDKIHSISKYLLHIAYDLGLEQNTPFQIINPAMDLKSLPSYVKNNSKNKFKIATIARFNWIKGLEILTEVALKLKNAGIEFEWTLIGTGDISEKERYLYDINDKHLLSQIKNIGKISHEETLKILQESDMYVQTSLNEGFCNALLEAQAVGLPCVAFDVGGISENIIDGETGFLIEAFNLDKMVQKIKEILYLSLEEKSKISLKGIERVRKNFNIDKQKKEFNEFYRF
ncbi:MAG: glycosyltransferase family 4 protein [Gelidibacter sp.]